MALLFTFLEIAKKIDQILLLFMNNDYYRKILDPVMIVLRNPYTWSPLYIFLLWFSITKMKRNASLFILLSLLILAITDVTCSYILKPFFERLRPCNDPELTGLVRILVDCPGRYSFPSNYAATHFGLATFWFYYIKNVTRKKWLWLFAWLPIISYAQVYVGKDFPSDILAGALLGCLTGWIVFSMRKYICLAKMFVYGMVRFPDKNIRNRS